MIPLNCWELKLRGDDYLALFVDCDVEGVAGLLARIQFSSSLINHLLDEGALLLFVNKFLVGQREVVGEVFVVEGEGIEGEVFLFELEAAQHVCDNVEFAFDVAQLRTVFFDKESPTHDAFGIEGC